MQLIMNYLYFYTYFEVQWDGPTARQNSSKLALTASCPFGHSSNTITAIMHFLAFLGALSVLFTSCLADTSADLFYWPVGASQPSILARITYDPVSLSSEVVSYQPPADNARDSLVRVGLYTTTATNPKQWTGSLVSSSSLIGGGHHPTFRLHLGPANEVYHVSLAASSDSRTQSRGSGPQVELVPSTPGKQPHLNRPVVVRPDGETPEEVVEKSFLQK